MATAAVLVRGAGDLASGVALRLHRAGFRLLLTETARPQAVRRTVSFSEAVYEGEARVEGIAARLADDSESALRLMRAGEIAVLVDPELSMLESLPRDLRFLAVVDGRMRKRSEERPPVEFVVGLGPGFIPGENCDVVVETMRGHTLGRVYRDRPAAADTGQPEGDPRRVLRAPCDGVLQPRAGIGDMVAAGQIVAVLDCGDVPPVAVRSSLTGTVRGLLRPGHPVQSGMKIGDVDPRAVPEYCMQVSDKALAVGGGVLEALLSRPAIRQGMLGER